MMRTTQLGLKETSCGCLCYKDGLRRTHVSRSPGAWTLPGRLMEGASYSSAVLGLATHFLLKMTQLPDMDEIFSLNFLNVNTCLGPYSLREIELK